MKNFKSKKYIYREREDVQASQQWKGIWEHGENGNLREINKK